MQPDVMTIRGKDAAARYEVCGHSVRDMRVCQHPETAPGTVCQDCGLPKPNTTNEVTTKQL